MKKKYPMVKRDHEKTINLPSLASAETYTPGDNALTSTRLSDQEDSLKTLKKSSELQTMTPKTIKEYYRKFGKRTNAINGKKMRILISMPILIGLDQD